MERISRTALGGDRTVAASPSTGVSPELYGGRWPGGIVLAVWHRQRSPDWGRPATHREGVRTRVAGIEMQRENAPMRSSVRDVRRKIRSIVAAFAPDGFLHRMSARHRPAKDHQPAE